jgi:hypothetical protein
MFIDPQKKFFLGRGGGVVVATYKHYSYMESDFLSSSVNVNNEPLQLGMRMFLL